MRDNCCTIIEALCDTVRTRTPHLTCLSLGQVPFPCPSYASRPILPPAPTVPRRRLLIKFEPPSLPSPPPLLPMLPQSRADVASSLQSRLEAAERRCTNSSETMAARLEGLEARLAATAALAAAGSGAAAADTQIRHLEEEVKAEGYEPLY